VNNGRKAPVSTTIYEIGAERQESVVRWSSYTMKRPSQNSMGYGEVITAVMDDPYDFTNPEHREDVLLRMANDVLNSSGFDCEAMDVIIKEAESAIRKIKDELPF